MRTIPIAVIVTCLFAGVAAAAEGEGTASGAGAAERVVELLRSGGTTVAILLALSVLALSSGIERLVRLNRRAVVPPGEEERLSTMVREGRTQEALERSRQGRSTLHRIAALAIEHRTEGKQDVSTMCADIARWELRAHLQRCYPLAVVATIAPLLGLFGTVYGMIGAFGTVADLGTIGDPSLLAGDISKALITTAVGLAVAIPALGLHHWFKHKVTNYANLLEEEATVFIGTLFRASPERPETQEATDAH